MKTLQSLLLPVTLILMTACSNDDSPVTPPPTTTTPDTAAPTIEALADIELTANSMGNVVALSITDNSGSVVDVTAASSNEALFGDASLIVSDELLVLTPSIDTIGIAEITITATDSSGNQSSIAVLVRVVENLVSAREFIRTTFALPANSEPVKINGVALIQDIQNQNEFEDLLQVP